jgi:hypothetical protein
VESRRKLWHLLGRAQAQRMYETDTEDHCCGVVVSPTKLGDETFRYIMIIHDLSAVKMVIFGHILIT